MWRSLNLLQKFSLLSFVSIALLSLALGFVTSEMLTRNMTRQEWAETAELVRYQVRTYALERLFSDLNLRQDRARFKEALGSLLALPEVVRIKVWGRDGAVIWSDDDRLIGRAFPDNRELREALAGRVSVQIKPVKKAENAQERRQFSKLAEVYVPIFLETRRDHVVGVLEVYKVPARLFSGIRQVAIIVWATSLSGGLLLYLSLFWIVRVSYRSQLRLERSLRGSMEEIKTTTDKNAELDAFVYSVSHDLKAPLLALQGMTSLLLEDCGPQLDSTGRHYVERIQANAQHMERLILDLLALSRIGREAQPPEPVHLAELVDGLLATLAAPIRARRIKIIRGDLATVWAIRTQMEQVLGNLLSNAVKYLGDVPSPTIDITTTDRGAFVECAVTDNGIGIDPAYHDTIFELFQRLGDLETEGTGVGLAIAKKIVEAAGGRLWVESTKGQGATFRFTWPKAPAGRAAARPGAGAPVREASGTDESPPSGASEPKGTNHGIR